MNRPGSVALHYIRDTFALDLLMSACDWLGVASSMGGGMASWIRSDNIRES